MPGRCSAQLPYVANAELTKKGFSLPELPEKNNPDDGNPPTTLGKAVASPSRGGPLLKQEALC